MFVSSEDLGALAWIKGPSQAALLTDSPKERVNLSMLSLDRHPFFHALRKFILEYSSQTSVAQASTDLDLSTTLIQHLQHFEVLQQRERLLIEAYNLLHPSSAKRCKAKPKGIAYFNTHVKSGVVNTSSFLGIVQPSTGRPMGTKRAMTEKAELSSAGTIDCNALMTWPTILQRRESLHAVNKPTSKALITALAELDSSIS